MFEQMLQEYRARGRTRKKLNEEKENPSQATENECYEEECEPERPGHTKNDRPILRVKGNSYVPMKEQKRPPHPAPYSTSPTLPNVDIHSREQAAAETMRVEQIRANERFRELARALGGQQVIVHAHCGPESVNVGDHG